MEQERPGISLLSQMGLLHKHFWPLQQQQQLCGCSGLPALVQNDWNSPRTAQMSAPSASPGPWPFPGSFLHVLPLSLGCCCCSPCAPALVFQYLCSIFRSAEHLQQLPDVLELGIIKPRGVWPLYLHGERSTRSCFI